VDRYLLLFLTLFVTACATSEPIATDTSIPLTPVPDPTDTTTPPIQIPPTQIPQPIEVAFDGNDCTVAGPTELPAGEHIFIFIDGGDRGAELYLLRLADYKNTQDLRDGQSEPGEWYPKPPWVYYDTKVSVDSQESNGRRVDTSTWRLDRIGEHTIACWVPSEPQMIWFPAALMIVEAISD
jgi:hypothetical protein